MRSQIKPLVTRIVAQSLSDRVFEQICEAIVRGDLVPGQRIAEAELARQFGISRGPLREALMRLEGRKLVERKPNLGAYVVELSERGLDELLRMREALEGMACRLAASNMSDQEIGELQQCLDCCHNGTATASPDYYDALEDFHVRVVRGSRNERLITACCDELFYQFRVYRHHSCVRVGERAQAACQEHQTIIDALSARDPDKAERAMRDHLTQVRAGFIWKDGPVAPTSLKQPAG